VDKFSRRYKRHLRKALRHSFKGQYHTYMAKLVYALDKVPEFEIAVEEIQEQIEDLADVDTDFMPLARFVKNEVVCDPEDANGEE
jgi:hypothetical protein